MKRPAVSVLESQTPENLVLSSHGGSLGARFSTLDLVAVEAELSARRPVKSKTRRPNQTVTSNNIL